MDSAIERYYFDWAATAPPLPRTEGPSPEIPALTKESVPFGNPSSPHLEGREARAALEAARSRCAAVLGVETKQLYFSSGGTESNAIPIHAMALRKNPGTLLFSAAEHPSVRENVLILERLGLSSSKNLQISSIPVAPDGRLTERELEAVLNKKSGARFITFMAVNNETGSVSDIGTLVKLIRSQEKAPTHIHSDLVQALGKLPLNFGEWGLDSAAFSAHKLGGPRGIGLLYLRKPIDALCAGGGQEGGIRPGTENTAGALAFAECLERLAKPETAAAEYDAAQGRWKTLIKALRSIKRCTLIPADRGDEDERFSPWILQIAFKGIPGEVMTRALDDAGFAVSTGSACSSRSHRRPVLEAMGIEEERRLEGIRISQGWSTKIEDIEKLIAGIKKVLEVL
jgi:cysteine desulfurase